MSLNNSSGSDVDFNPKSSSVSTLIQNLQKCWSSRTGALHIIFLAIINCLVLLPLCIFILDQGLKKWRQHRSGMVWSHSDIFTYHMIIIELLNVTGSILCCLGVYANFLGLELVGIYLLANVFSGQMSFHILTCVERYLAVVHPITYMSLKKATEFRNVVICCVWVVCFSGMGVLYISCHLIITFVSFAVIPVILVIILYFSISVLFALMHPGPGGECRNRRRVDQSKLRAFITITVILVVLLMRFIAAICIEAVYNLQMETTGDDEKCDVWLSEFWFTLPSSLVLPLLFLQRAGKLSCCKNRNMSERKNAMS